MSGAVVGLGVGAGDGPAGWGVWPVVEGVGGGAVTVAGGAGDASIGLALALGDPELIVPVVEPHPATTASRSPPQIVASGLPVPLLVPIAQPLPWQCSVNSLNRRLSRCHGYGLSRQPSALSLYAARLRPYRPWRKLQAAYSETAARSRVMVRIRGCQSRTPIRQVRSEVELQARRPSHAMSPWFPADGDSSSAELVSRPAHSIRDRPESLLALAHAASANAEPAPSRNMHPASPKGGRRSAETATAIRIAGPDRTLTNPRDLIDGLF